MTKPNKTICSHIKRKYSHGTCFGCGFIVVISSNSIIGMNVGWCFVYALQKWLNALIFLVTRVLQLSNSNGTNVTKLFSKVRHRQMSIWNRKYIGITDVNVKKKRQKCDRTCTGHHSAQRYQEHGKRQAKLLTCDTSRTMKKKRMNEKKNTCEGKNLIKKMENVHRWSFG